MVSLGYHISHEQFRPSQLLQWVQRAEQAGFTHALSSDHFLPWSQDQGESGFAWSWLGAAMQATNLHFRIVNAPGQRYHPAIIAQAAATLMEMFPHRFWLTVGSGQALNEHITGTHWPSKGDRNTRLKECVDISNGLPSVVELKPCLPVVPNQTVLTVTHVLPSDAQAPVVATLSLTAEERQKSRHRFTADDGTPVYLNLPRGTTLVNHTLLASREGDLVRVVARPQPVVLVRAETPFQLMKAAYHLGNRHVPLELATDYLKLEPDPVLEAMVLQLGGTTVTPATLPFEPETGAYSSSPSHAHAHH